MQDSMTVEPGQCHTADIKGIIDFKRYEAVFRVPIQGNVLLAFDAHGKQADLVLLSVAELLQTVQVPTLPLNQAKSGWWELSEVAL